MRIGSLVLLVTVEVLTVRLGICQEPQPLTPVSAALRFFDALADVDPQSVFPELRPVPPSVSEREAARALLPAKGAVTPTAPEFKKLESLQPVLIYHERDEVFDIKVIDVPQALIGLYARVILLISRPALALLTPSELQAVAAHEIAHDLFWGEFELARSRGDSRSRQQLELQCDGISGLTLIALGMDPTRLVTAMKKMDRLNKQFGTSSNIADYPTPDDRYRFISTLLREHRSRRR